MEFVQNNILLIGVAFVSGAMLLWPHVRRSSGGPWVDTLAATQLINREDALVIDVRDTNDYANGHLIGAKNIPLPQIESRLSELERHKDKPVIVVCNSGQNLAPKAMAGLRAKGFTRLHNLSGGYQGWLSAGLPVEKK